MNEVFIAKNGRPYVKDENGKVRFISSAEWEKHKQGNKVKENGRAILVVLTIIGAAILIATTGWTL
jgi:hypothetical protein